MISIVRMGVLVLRMPAMQYVFVQSDLSVAHAKSSHHMELVSPQACVCV